MIWVMRLQRGHQTLSPSLATVMPFMDRLALHSMTWPPCDVRSPSTMKPMICMSAPCLGGYLAFAVDNAYGARSVLVEG